MSRTIEQGFERDRLAGDGLLIRWWFVLFLDDEDGRSQRPRQRVASEPEAVVVGGRVESDQEARTALEEAKREAEREYEYYWRGQPSHVLGLGGALIPLDRLELENLTPSRARQLVQEVGS